jgi:chloride channel protein, CIC family
MNKTLSAFSTSRFMRIWRGTLIGIVIGIVSGFGGIVFNFLLRYGTHFFTNDLIRLIYGRNADSHLFIGIPLVRWAMIMIPALGGLLAGFIVFRYAPEAEGHGTDAMIDSFHRKKGFVRRRVPIIKTIASAITIGSGGSAGKEGPIAQIGSGFGSVMATFLKMDDRERRTMLLAGAAGGIGAIFKAPLGAALFVTEVLYRKADFEVEAIIPCILSSIVAFMVYTFYEGTAVLFKIPSFSLATPAQLPFYALLGIVCAAVGLVYVRCFYGMRDRVFKRIAVPPIFKPAIGGLLIGILGFSLPQVFHGGYQWIQSAIDGQLGIRLMLILVAAKIVATSFTISSGGSGGVFAPSLFIGSMLGGSFGIMCHRFFPHIVNQPSAFVLVGMGGFFAGVAKVPIAALIMVAEMTGGYTLIVPMMIVSSLAFLLLGHISLYEKQVATRVDSPAHVGDFAVDVMEHLLVKDAVVRGRKVETIRESTPFEDIMKLMISSSQQDFPVVNEDDRLTGIISMTDLRQAMADTAVHKVLIARDLAKSPETVSMNDSLNAAPKLMAYLDVRELPVVESDEAQKVVSILSRKDITARYHQEVEYAKGLR